MKGTFTGNSYNSCVKSLIPVETKKSLNESIEDLINTPSSPILQLVLHYTEICGIMWVCFFWRYPVRCTTPISFRNGFLNGHSDVSIPNFHSHFHLEFFLEMPGISVFPPKKTPGGAVTFPTAFQATALELQALAEVLHVRLSDLMVCPLKDEEEVLRVGRMMVLWLDGGWMVVGWWFWKVWLVKNLPQKWKLVKSESKSHWVCFIDSGDGSVFLQVVTFAQLGFMGTQRRQIQGGRG